jgi:hypothetical protein
MTKAALEALVNALLAPAQPITANGMHKPSMQKIIDELYDANSRGAALSGVDVSVSLNSGDKVLVLRSGVAKLVDKSLFYSPVPLLTDWNMDTNAFPSGSVKGQRYYGVITTSCTLLDVSGNPLPSKIFATALQDSASTSNPAHWAFTYTIN